MKRCPDCEFLYYDDQEHCDMDGSRLMYTTTLPPATDGVVAPPKSIWGALAIPLLATLVLGAVLFILYRPTRPATSPASGPTKPASQRMPAAGKDSQLPASDASQSPANAPAESPSSEEPAAGPANSTKPKTAKPDNSAPAANQSAPVSQIQEAPNSQTVGSVNKPAGSQVSNQTSPQSSKAAAGSYPISNHPYPPGAPATATPKAANQNANKDSKINTFFKKAGRILKKPF